jgi:hypothetical protein
MLKLLSFEPLSLIRSCGVAVPTNQVQEQRPVALIEFAIEDLCNLILQLALDLDQRQWRLDVSWDGIWMSELELGNVKDRVNSMHVLGKFNSEGSGTGLGQ